MSRLTNKEFIDTYEPTLKKLCELENIEEELGIDLITFFKVLIAKKIYSYSYKKTWSLVEKELEKWKE